MFKEESLDNNTCGEKGIKLKEENYIDITDDSEDENNINKNEIINIKINKLNKPSTKTKKIIEEKAYNKTKDLLNKKRKRQISKKINFGLEFKLFYKLVDKYGIDKVLSSLFNKDIYSMNEIDKVINEINDTCGKEKFISNIIKTYYNCLKDYISSNPEIKSALNDKSIFDQQRIIHNDDNNELKNISMLNFQFNTNDIIEIPVNKEDKKENEHNSNSKSENDILKLESHYNKDSEGNIYKYKIMYLLGKLAIFKCADHNCNGDAVFDLETKIFKTEQKHNKIYSKHDFVVKENVENDIAFKELSNNNKYNNAQILFEGNAKIVRLYS